MIAWLQGHGVPYDVVDDGTKGKVSALYYLDDKGIRFEDNWPEVIAKIKQYEHGKSNQGGQCLTN
jgi:hypothetical protein